MKLGTSIRHVSCITEKVSSSEVRSNCTTVQWKVEANGRKVSTKYRTLQASWLDADNWVGSVQYRRVIILIQTNKNCQSKFMATPLYEKVGGKDKRMSLNRKLNATHTLFYANPSNNTWHIITGSFMSEVQQCL